ncbi:PAS domain S-box protein [Mucilaginibacter agri]|uniref:histidine kinase n=1 Tax=Mucilaginibacter agri TaxID=2695265 RepID=A0A965ZEI0_9SPHI|nr:PAS domain S-box protein [Mucilaginibacter agri]NCD69589.1 PAS domain S-box protein [Mucilaginibacter agri]
MNFASDINPDEIDILRALIEGAPDPIGLYVGPEMRIRVANKAIHEAWGKTESVVGKTFREALPEVDGQGFNELLDQVFTTGIAYEAKTQRVDFLRDGKVQTFYFDFAYTPLKNANGEVWGILNTAKDLTELVLAKRQATEADERRSFTLAAAGIGNWDLDILNNTVWWDDRCKELYGFSKDDIVPYKEVLKYMHPVDRLKVDKAVAAALRPESGGSYDVKFRTIGADDNRLRWLHCQGKAYFDIENNPIRFSGIAQDITEQIAADEKAKSAEQLTSLAIEAAGAGTFFLDIITDETIYSPTFIKILTGQDEAELSHDDMIDLIHPDDLNKRKQAFEIAMETGKLHYEIRFTWLDGSVHWIRTLGSYIFDPEGIPVVLMGICQDVTAEVEAREEQQRLLWLIENSSDFISLSSSEGHVTYVNKTGIELMGLENLEAAKRHNSDYVLPSELEKLREEINPILLRDGRWEGQVTYKHFVTGEAIPGQGITLLLREPVTGKPLGRASLFRDLRPDIAARKALADREQLFRGITTASPTALWMSDANAMITYVNQIWIDWTGHPLESHMGEGWLSTVLEEDVQQAIDKFLGDFKDRKFHESQFRIKHTDGTLRWIVCTGNPQYNEAGKFSGYIGACVDITEQKQLQNQKDEFIGIASHELKTPVTSIKAYAQVLEAMFLKSGDERKAAMLVKMNNQIDRLTSLIGDLLDVTKIQSGRLQFNDTWFDFNQLLLELVEDLQRTTERHQIIPELQPIGSVYADKDRIGQVLTNLVTNAIKYSPDADKIIVKAKVVDGEVSVCVEDFGIGISHDKKDKVFEQFYRVSGDKQHTFPGLGLGLYISSEIVKREGGRIWVNSVPGQGSTFCFALPIKQM